MSETTLKLIQDKLNITFSRPALVQEALTHASSKGGENYERMEFLGDRVLGLAVADLLYETFPQDSEGGLAKRHAALVQGTTLAEIAREINLGDLLILSDAERQSGGAANDHILADCIESLLGALYLDQGFGPCRETIKRLVGKRIETVKKPPQDPKTELQEWAQGRGLPLPVYEIVERSGPDHAPLFKIQVSVEGLTPALAEGASRRLAEKAAAEKLLKQAEQQS